MAKIRDVISSKLKRFYFMMDEVELETLLVENGLDGEVEFSISHSAEVKKAMISIIPELLLMPDVSQGDFSVKRNKDGLKSYYSLICTELGVEDKLNPTTPDPEINDRSSIW